MATEINRNMLCQFRILSLTHKGNFPILTPSKSEFLSILEKIEEIGVLAKQHGFVADLLYSFDKPVDMQRLDYFKSILT